MSAARLDRLRAQLEEHDLDGLLVTTPSNRRWLAGFTGSAGVLLVTGDLARFATDSRSWEQAAGPVTAHWSILRLSLVPSASSVS